MSVRRIYVEKNLISISNHKLREEITEYLEINIKKCQNS